MLQRTNRVLFPLNNSWALISLLLVPLADCVAAPSLERHDFKNGLKLLLYASPATDQVALVVLYGVGEDHDPIGESGLAHLTEHVYATAAAGEALARTVADVARAYPDGWNAQTGTDYTVFATVFPKERLEEELRDAAARMRDLRPAASDLDRERPRLLHELDNMYGGIPDLACLNLARESVRPLGHGHRKGGVPEHIKRLTVNDVQQWWSKYYKPVNATIVLAGAFDAAQARKMVAAHFSSIPSGEKAPAPRKPEPPNIGRAQVIAVESARPDAPAYACLAFSAPLPGREHYAGCLVLLGRMLMRAASTGGKVRVTFSPLDDPPLIALSAPLAPDETLGESLMKLHAFVAETTIGPLQKLEPLRTKNTYGFLLGMVDYPDVMIRNNLYGVAFSLGRRHQLGLDGATLARNLERLTGTKLEAAAQAVFGSDHRVGIVVRPE